MALPLGPDRVRESDYLYPDFLSRVVRPHWLNKDPVDGQLYLQVCADCWRADRGVHAMAAAAVEEDDDALARAIAESLLPAEDDDELARAFAESIHTEEDDDELARALAESLQEQRPGPDT